MQKVLVIAGPTAVGKTALSIEWAKKWNGEIISGDSMQVYQKLDIGTAKVKPEEMQGIPHYLLDYKEPTAEYSVADFQKDGRKAIAEIAQKGKLPIIVGGTGLYLQSLLYDFHLGTKEETISKEVRKQVAQWQEEKTAQELWEELKQRDEKTAQTIHPNNRRRVARALEVVLSTGESFQQKETPQPLYDFQLIILNTDRERLYDRINQRVDLMMEEGLLDEAQWVQTLGPVQSSRGIGYKEFMPYFSGEISLEEAINDVKQHSRQYAKRQLTWFRNRLSGTWLDLWQEGEKERVEKEVQEWLKN